ncbi:NADH-quinone oxidoreductase subunit F [Deltaproteobacteria bacterium Smac51]|nr:NADH-quinone oxidoreductase subunit F [Deltaproteobacteria bacterium Smac51]
MENPAALEEFRKAAKPKVAIRHHADAEPFQGVKNHIMVCCGTGCTSSGAGKVVEAFEKELARFGMDKTVEVVVTGCHGFCEMGPLVIIYPQDMFYVRVQEEDVPEIVEMTIKGGQPVDRLLYRGHEGAEPTMKHHDIDFYSRQNRITLRNCGLINPENIEEYIAEDGYAALAKALEDHDAIGLLAEIKESGLRGRGGGGFPTGIKWELCRRADGDKKYVVCNADEGDPGAFMDRAILEGDPHKVIEGMAIGAYVIGADEGYIYVRAEYPLAVHRLRIAIAQAEQMGLLGENILGSGFNFKLKIKEGAGAFVCGEETALIKSIEGERGMPVARPPFPAVSGLWKKPTNNNNVETWANVPPIILKGAKWYGQFGTEKSKGTKVFALTGKLRHTGLAEVPMGMTMREIIFDIGGGILGGKKFKAVQIGGPSGGCLPADLIDRPVDYDSLIEVGAMMGSGGLVVVDEDTCMVDLARFFLNFTRSESCGKCTPCREGTTRMLEILNNMTQGKGKRGDIELLEELARNIKLSALCGLGQTCPNPILSTLRYFRHEYEAHIYDKTCPAKQCTDLLSYWIDPEKCIGCGACKKVCPVEAITGERKLPHEIDTDKCIKCGSCIDVCRKAKAVIKR